jgi:hypothetical protein
MASPKKMVRATSSNLLADDAFGMTTAENLSVSHSHDSDVAATTQPARLFSHEFMDHQTATAPSATTYNLLVAGLVSFSVAGGYLAGTQPNGEWRFFSWHPLLMTIGMVGLMGIGAITKKLGGYTNTKVNRKKHQYSLACPLTPRVPDIRHSHFAYHRRLSLLRILPPIVARNDWMGSYSSGLGRYILHLQEQGNVWEKSRTCSHRGFVLVTVAYDTSPVRLSPFSNSTILFCTHALVDSS